MNYIRRNNLLQRELIMVKISHCKICWRLYIYKDQIVLLKFRSSNICPGKLVSLETVVTQKIQNVRSYHGYNLIAVLNPSYIIHTKQN